MTAAENYKTILFRRIVYGEPFSEEISHPTRLDVSECRCSAILVPDRRRVDAGRHRLGGPPPRPDDVLAGDGLAGASRALYRRHGHVLRADRSWTVLNRA